MLGATEDFTEEQLALMPPAPEGDEGSDAGQGETKGEAAADAAAPSPAAESTQGAAPAPQAGGDLRQALRASRHAERSARDRAERAERERDDLLKKLPNENHDALTDEELADLEEAGADNLAVQKLLRIAKEKAPAAPAAPAPASDEGFVPVVLPEAVQAVVDDNVDALTWQHDPNQERFTVLDGHVAVLNSHPTWAGKPLPDRIAEAVRRTKADFVSVAGPAAPAPSPKTTTAPTTYEQLPPSTLSDLPGGGGAQPEPSRLARYQSMTQEQIFDELARGGG